MSGSLPICYSCKHFRKQDTSCEAFPQGIPHAILTNYHDHRLEFPGDRGIRWASRGPSLASARPEAVFGPGAPTLVYKADSDTL